MDTGFPVAEALRYLQAKEVALECCLVSKEMLGVGSRKELWSFFIERDFGVEYKGESPVVDYYKMHRSRHSLRILLPEKSLYGVYYPTSPHISWKSTSHQFPYDATICPLPNQYILILGGERYSRPCPDVFLLCEETMETVVMTSMRSGRIAAGVVEVEGRVYVFGGMGRNLAVQTAEMMDLGLAQWTDLRDMLEAKAAIYPLRYKDRIYLAGVQSRLLEEYLIPEQDYRVLLVLDNLFHHFAFEANGLFIWMDSFGKFTTFNPVTHKTSFQVNKATHAEMPLNSPLCAYHDYMYYASVERGVLCVYSLSLPTLEFRKMFTETWERN